MMGAMTISVFLADDNLLVREGVRALMELEEDIEIVGVAGDFEGLVDGAEATEPQVVVTDIRMPPGFQREGLSSRSHACIYATQARTLATGMAIAGTHMNGGMSPSPTPIPASR